MRAGRLSQSRVESRSRCIQSSRGATKRIFGREKLTRHVQVRGANRFQQNPYVTYTSVEDDLISVGHAGRQHLQSRSRRSRTGKKREKTRGCRVGKAYPVRPCANLLLLCIMRGLLPRGKAVASVLGSERLESARGHPARAVRTAKAASGFRQEGFSSSRPTSKPAAD